MALRPYGTQPPAAPKAAYVDSPPAAAKAAAVAQVNAPAQTAQAPQELPTLQPTSQPTLTDADWDSQDAVFTALSASLELAQLATKLPGHSKARLAQAQASGIQPSDLPGLADPLKQVLATRELFQQAAAKNTPAVARAVAVLTTGGTARWIREQYPSLLSGIQYSLPPDIQQQVDRALLLQRGPRFPHEKVFIGEPEQGGTGLSFELAARSLLAATTSPGQPRSTHEDFIAEPEQGRTGLSFELAARSLLAATTSPGQPRSTHEEFIAEPEQGRTGLSFELAARSLLASTTGPGAQGAHSKEVIVQAGQPTESAGILHNTSEVTHSGALDDLGLGRPPRVLLDRGPLEYGTDFPRPPRTVPEKGVRNIFAELSEFRINPEDLNRRDYKSNPLQAGEGTSLTQAKKWARFHDPAIANSSHLPVEPKNYPDGRSVEAVQRRTQLARDLVEYCIEGKVSKVLREEDLSPEQTRNYAMVRDVLGATVSLIDSLDREEHQGDEESSMTVPMALALYKTWLSADMMPTASRLKFKRVAAGVGLVLPHNLQSFQEQYGEKEGTVLWRRFCDRFKVLHNRELSVENQTNFSFKLPGAPRVSPGR